MTKLDELHESYGQSPWLDNLSRDAIHGPALQAWLAKGIRGVTSNPSIFQKAMTAGTAYDEQLRRLVKAGVSTEDAYWTMAVDDITDASTTPAGATTGSCRSRCRPRSLVTPVPRRAMRSGSTTGSRCRTSW